MCCVFLECLIRQACCILWRIISSSPQTRQSTVLCVCVRGHLPWVHLDVCNVDNEQPEPVKCIKAHRRDEMDSPVFFFHHYYPGCQATKLPDAAAIYMGLMYLLA